LADDREARRHYPSYRIPSLYPGVIWATRAATEKRPARKPTSLGPAFRESNRELVFRDTNEVRELRRSQPVEISAKRTTKSLPAPVPSQKRRGRQPLGGGRPLDPSGELLDQELDRSPVKLDITEVQVREGLDRPNMPFELGVLLAWGKETFVITG
jgi:hypothetical protein